MNEKRICVDLNGVLDTYRGWRGQVTWHPARPGAAEFLRELRRRGHEVVVLTTRDPAAARAWLERHGLDRYVSDVTNVKPPALAYVDDRAVRFTGRFDETLAELESFRTHWEIEGGNDPTAVERQQAAAILAHLGHHPARADRLRIVRRDRRTNTVDAVHLGDGRILVVKRPRDPAAAYRFRNSRAAAALLRGTGVIVPEYLPLPAELEATGVLAYWWVPGETLREAWARVPARARAGAVRGWGELVARMHAIELPGHGSLLDALEGGLPLAEFLTADLTERLRPGVKGQWPTGLPAVDALIEAAPAAARAAGPRAARLVHNDLFDQNVLCRRTGRGVRCVGVLDFEDAFAGPADADLAKAELLHGPLFGQPWLDWDWLTEFTAGYGRAPDPLLLGYFRTLALANMGFHAACTGLVDNARRVALAARAEAAALGTGKRHVDVVATAP